MTKKPTADGKEVTSTWGHDYKGELYVAVTFPTSDPEVDDGDDYTIYMTDFFANTLQERLQNNFKRMISQTDLEAIELFSDFIYDFMNIAELRRKEDYGQLIDLSGWMVGNGYGEWLSEAYTVTED